MSGSYNAGGTPGRVVLVDPSTLDDYVAKGTTASPSVVQGTVANDAVAAGNPLVGGGRASITAPTAVNSGDAVYAWYGREGQAVVALGTSEIVSRAQPALAVFSQARDDAFNYAVATVMFVSNGTSLDPMVKPNITKRIASSAASGNPDFLKASPGELVVFWGQNGAAIIYVQFYNKASAPTIGTDTPILTYPVAANERFSIAIPGGGYYFATGIAYAFTTDAAGTTGAAAAAVTSCNIIGS